MISSRRIPAVILLAPLALIVIKRKNGGTFSEAKPVTPSLKPRPCVAATWTFGAIAVKESSKFLMQGRSALDAVEQGIRCVEIDNQDQYWVGVGGFPNAEGVMELDAAIMDDDCRYGAVMALQDIANPISVARTVMEKCIHNVLVGDGAQKWALSNGFTIDKGILTPKMHLEWLERQMKQKSDVKGHDTIGLICLDADGVLACGTSTSGYAYKHPGRVGDAPIIGCGLYCDKVGAAVATGDGEEIMRSCLSFLIVELIRMGRTPQEACSIAIQRLFSVSTDPKKSRWVDSSRLYVGVVAMDRLGNVGAASTLSNDNRDSYDNNRPSFPVCVWRKDDSEVPGKDCSITVIEASLPGTSF